MISVSFSHKSGLIFLSLSVPHMELGNSNESWQVGFKSAESKAAMFFASGQRRQAEQLFTLGLSVESFLQMHATRLLDLKEKFMAYVSWEVGQISQMSFFSQWDSTVTGNMTRAQWVMWDKRNYRSRLHLRSWAPWRRGSCHLAEGPAAAQHCDLSSSMFLHRKHQGENCTTSGTLTCFISVQHAKV